MMRKVGRRAARGPLAGPRQAAAVCVECGSTTALIPIGVAGVSICLQCVSTLLAGCVPDHVGWGESRPVYWYSCVCGREVRCGRYSVDLDGLAARAEATDDRQLRREAVRIERYRGVVEGVPSGGVMLCRWCAAGAGVPLPAPVPARVPSNVIAFPSGGKAGRHGEY